MLYASPVTLKEANEFIAAHHRHHDPVRFHLFSVGCREIKDGELKGVAVVMRPAAPAYNGKPIAEVSRLATDGTQNTCSFLLARAANAAFQLGYLIIQTYTLTTEPGTSLAAAGWEWCGERKGAPWNTKSRPRKDTHPIGPKDKWMRISPELERHMKKQTSANSEGQNNG